MLPTHFDAMERDLEAATRHMPGETGVSVALWRLRALVLAYRWAMQHGYKDPLVDPEDKPCLTCHGR